MRPPDGPAATAVALEQIPFTFSYRFTCHDDRCTGHEPQILAWEIGQAYRNWSRSHPGQWEAMIRQKYEGELPNATFTLWWALLLRDGTPS